MTGGNRIMVQSPGGALTVDEIIADVEQRLRQFLRDRYREAETLAQHYGGDDFDPDVYDAAIAPSRAKCDQVLAEALEQLRTVLGATPREDQ